MKLITDTNYRDLDTLVAVIARSEIVVAAPADVRQFPAGFDSVDIAILEWIAAEGRRAGRVLDFVRM
jgi:hypothetical protein